MNSVVKYQIIWVMVLFDLPTSTKLERKNASKFRMHLEDLGFRRVQFSVYEKFAGVKYRTETIINSVKEKLPLGGDVRLMYFTDKQYADQVILTNLVPRKRKIDENQLMLF